MALYLGSSKKLRISSNGVACHLKYFVQTSGGNDDDVPTVPDEPSVEFATYIYPSVVLPDIESVWTDKQTYPYAAIGGSDGHYQLKLMDERPIRYATNFGFSEGTVQVLCQVDSFDIFLTESALSAFCDGLGITVEDAYSFGIKLGEWFLLVESMTAEYITTDFFWTSTDILNLDGSTYLSAYTPVPAGDGNVCYKGVELPELPESELPYAIVQATSLDGFGVEGILASVLFMAEMPVLNATESMLEFGSNVPCHEFRFTDNSDIASSLGYPVGSWYDMGADEYSAFEVTEDMPVIWTSHDILNTDGTTYLTAYEPIPVDGSTEQSGIYDDEFPIEWNTLAVQENPKVSYAEDESFVKISNLLLSAEDLADACISFSFAQIDPEWADAGEAYCVYYVSMPNDDGYPIHMFVEVGAGTGSMLYCLTVPENSNGHEPGFYMLWDDTMETTVDFTLAKVPITYDDEYPIQWNFTYVTSNAEFTTDGEHYAVKVSNIVPTLDEMANLKLSATVDGESLDIHMQGNPTVLDGVPMSRYMVNGDDFVLYSVEAAGQWGDADIPEPGLYAYYNLAEPGITFTLTLASSGEPTTYLYPSVVLPDIERVWTGDLKALYPYAFLTDIQKNEGIPYMLMFCDEAPRLDENGSVVCDATSYHANVYAITDPPNLEWELLGDDQTFFSNVIFDNADVPSILWTSHDILNTDGSVYLAAYTPVDAGGGMVCYKGVELPDINEVWTDKSTYSWVGIAYFPSTGNRDLFVSTAPFRVNTSSGYYVASADMTYLQYVYDETSDTWVYETSYTKAAGDPLAPISYVELGWCYGADLVDQDGSTYLAASEPIPVGDNSESGGVYDDTFPIEWNTLAVQGNPTGEFVSVPIIKISNLTPTQGEMESATLAFVYENHAYESTSCHTDVLNDKANLYSYVGTDNYLLVANEGCVLGTDYGEVEVALEAGVYAIDLGCDGTNADFTLSLASSGHVVTWDGESDIWYTDENDYLNVYMAKVSSETPMPIDLLNGEVTVRIENSPNPDSIPNGTHVAKIIGVANGDYTTNPSEDFTFIDGYDIDNLPSGWCAVAYWDDVGALMLNAVYNGTQVASICIVKDVENYEDGIHFVKTVYVAQSNFTGYPTELRWGSSADIGQVLFDGDITTELDGEIAIGVTLMSEYAYSGDELAIECDGIRAAMMEIPEEPGLFVADNYDTSNGEPDLTKYPFCSMVQSEYIQLLTEAEGTYHVTLYRTKFADGLMKYGDWVAPALPDWDKSANPCATILRATYPSTDMVAYVLYCTKFTHDVQFQKYEPENGKPLHSQIIAGDWAELTETNLASDVFSSNPDKGIAYYSVVWTNYDMLDENGNVVMPGTEPESV